MTEYRGAGLNEGQSFAATDARGAKDPPPHFRGKMSHSVPFSWC